MNGVNYNEKEWSKIIWSPKRRPTPAEFLPYGDSLKGVELVAQVLAARDDTRLSLHVMHGPVSLHWAIAKLCHVGEPHTKAKNVCCPETLVISQVSVRNIIAFILLSFLFPLLVRGKIISDSVLQVFQGVFSTVSFSTRHFALRPHKKVNTVVSAVRYWHGHSSVR